MSSIKFGTDGWRAVIGEDFIPGNIERVIQAFCDWRKQEGGKNKTIVLGFDRRENSPESAQLIAEVLAGNGFTVLLSDQFCPTPCVSWMTKEKQASAGIVVTASHNPWEWNGVKFKEGYGGSAPNEYTREIENRLGEVKTINKIPYSDAVKKGSIVPFSPLNDYVSQLKRLVDIERIKKAAWRILYDPLYGAGASFLRTIVGDQVEEIHNGERRGEDFPPEPIEKNLGELVGRIKSGSADVGIATDGDADRIGAIDETGRFVSSHEIFALLLHYYVTQKGMKGTVVMSVSTSQMIPLLCKKYGLPLIETPIGFKHICSELVKHDSLMGGEESGGISFAPHIHERDGLLNGLFLLEMMSVKKKKLGELVSDLRAEIGTFHFQRVDCHLEKERIQKMQKELQSKKIARLAGETVASTNFIDGFKYILSDNSWLLVRASGTEPLVRIYAESPDENKVPLLLEEGKSLAGIG